MREQSSAFSLQCVTLPMCQKGDFLDKMKLSGLSVWLRVVHWAAKLAPKPQCQEAPPSLNTSSGPPPAMLFELFLQEEALHGNSPQQPTSCKLGSSAQKASRQREGLYISFGAFCSFYTFRQNWHFSACPSHDFLWQEESWRAKDGAKHVH